ncbi:glycosyltransferase 1 domain-containing protein 1 [Danio rerio]|uniref:Glycosyltransferase 1 domain-containing protein 1 n=1 Tax=Danio rerio TaxID=7955 RepID=A0A8M2BEP1_DANRE|nr:glycosyltransferase 1 domain-containing protein 1 [Danio rerio]|eukprot:XP_005167303.3 glycosyltransferase 1 domain-containing protein 1 [Danio rerio]
MRVLFLAYLSPKTGNCTTAERIRNHIEAAGHTCVLCDTRGLSSASDVSSLMTQEPRFEAALAIHLFKGGRLLLDVGLPFGVVFGGTDVNEDVRDEHKRAVMEEVLRKARFAVAFTDALKEQAEMLLVCESKKIHVQPQGIETRVASNFSWSDFLHNTGVCSKQVENLQVFLLVCGLRRVKDPLYLVEAFSEWHSQNPLVILIIIGPKMDPVFTAEVEESVKRFVGVFLADDLSQEELHAAMQKSFALVNSSLSEGMSAAILEAMDLGLPVLARDVPGNAAIVEHQVTGLLYSSPQEFISMSQKLLDDKELRKRLVRNGKNYITTCHNPMKERTTYQELLKKLH